MRCGCQHSQTNQQCPLKTGCNECSKWTCKKGVLIKPGTGNEEMGNEEMGK